jgi:SAM-dependent methyltransferase
MTVATLPAEEILLDVLACPCCKAPLAIRDDKLPCTACSFVGAISGGVMGLGAPAAGSFFDGRYQVMSAGHVRGNGEWRLCYGQQLDYIRPYLTAGTRVLDVGCGPDILYERDADCFLIGLDASGPSVAANQLVDLRVHGTATALPLAKQTLDVVMCLYSIHHMVGGSIGENRALVRSAFQEFARVLRPGGHLFVCEVNPWWPVSAAEQVLWNPTRRLLGERLDQYFWPQAVLESLGQELLPGAQLRIVTAEMNRLGLLSPVFTMQWLQIPRFLFPFQANLFHWRLPE